MTQDRKAIYGRGKGRQSESAQPLVEPGDTDRMSILARQHGMPLCDAGPGCTRVKGHDDTEPGARGTHAQAHHPSRQHSRAKEGVVIESWFGETGDPK